VSLTGIFEAAVLVPASSAEGEGYTPPGPGSFLFPPIFEAGGLGFTKAMGLVVLSAVIVLGFTVLASRKAAVVPGRLQFAGEMVYNFVRNSIARDNIGTEHFMRFVPYLFSLFMFIVVNNYYALIPFLQFPSFSRIGFIVPLALMSWLLYIGVGIWKHGAFGYLKHATVPGGVKGPILLLLIPLEFISNILVRPFTLTLRLFGNMFAGHILLVLFASGGAYLLTSGNALYGVVGVLSFGMGIAVSFLELLVLFLQAYVFTLLSAMYVGEALADEH